MTCTFFGHRRLYNDVDAQLTAAVTELIVSKGVNDFYVGAEGDLDRVVKRILRKLTAEFPHIRYSVVCSQIPTKASDDDSHLLYPGGLEEKYQKYRIHYKNLWMIERAQFVISYVNCGYGGAAKYTEIAKKKGKTVINIASP